MSRYTSGRRGVSNCIFARIMAKTSAGFFFTFQAGIQEPHIPHALASREVSTSQTALQCCMIRHGDHAVYVIPMCSRHSTQNAMYTFKRNGTKICTTQHTSDLWNPREIHYVLGCCKYTKLKFESARWINTKYIKGGQLYGCLSPVRDAEAEGRLGQVLFLVVSN